MTLEKYEKTLDVWANEEREKAAEAKQAGDERLMSIHLMKASMLGDMLKVLGKVELSGRTGTLEKIAAQQTAEAGRFKVQEDYDSAEKSEIKAATVRRALELIENGDE